MSKLLFIYTLFEYSPYKLLYFPNIKKHKEKKEKLAKYYLITPSYIPHFCKIMCNNNLKLKVH